MAVSVGLRVVGVRRIGVGGVGIGVGMGVRIVIGQVAVGVGVRGVELGRCSPDSGVM